MKLFFLMVFKNVYIVEMAKIFPKIINKNPEISIIGKVIYPPFPSSNDCPDIINMNSDGTEIIFDKIRSLKYF